MKKYFMLDRRKDKPIRKGKFKIKTRREVTLEIRSSENW